MTTALVTGGAGYIGAHVCKALADASITPVVYDDLSTGHRDFVRWGPFVEGDIRDLPTLTAALETHRPAIVLHFAALSQVGESTRRPELYWSVNVGGVATLLAAMRACEIFKLVFSSTAAIYGDASASLISETAAEIPLSPYGQTKLAAEWMMHSAEIAHGLRSVRLRYFNACGADSDGEIGEHHDPETHLIPLAFDAVMGRRPALSVFGADYPTPDGTAIRDYIHVMDLASAHVAAAKHLLGGGDSFTVNLGVGVGASVSDVLAAVGRVVGAPVPVTPAPRRLGDAPMLVADPRAAQVRLRWTAQRNLEASVADAWRWHQRRFGAS